MKVARLALRNILRAAIPTLSRIDRFNHQYDNISTEDPVDFTNGAVYIEVLTEQWEQLGGQQLQEADATIRVHVCRTFLGDTFEDSNSDLAVMDLPGLVYKALQGCSLVDNLGRDIGNALFRVDNQEDNDHDGLEIDIISFRTRLTDYLDDVSVNWTERLVELVLLNNGITNGNDPTNIFAALAADRYSVANAGDAVTIVWGTSGAASVTIDALGSGPQSAIGSAVVTIDFDTTIELTATLGATVVVRTIEITVGLPSGNAVDTDGNILVAVPAGGSGEVVDSVITMNATPFVNLLATQPFDVQVLDEDDNPVGAVDGEIVRIPNQPVFVKPIIRFNGIQVAELGSGENWFQQVTVNGEAPDSVVWDNPNANFNLVKAVPVSTLTIKVYSEVGLINEVNIGNYGAKVWIKLEETGIVSTSRTISINGSNVKVIEPPTNVYEWTIDSIGAVSITATATDGSGATANSVAFAFTSNVVIAHALKFDGVNDSAIAMSLVQYNENFSITLRFKFAAITGGQKFILSIEPILNIAFPYSFQIYYEPSDGKIHFMGWGNSWAPRGLGIVWAADLNWHHLTFTQEISTNTWKGYIDGVFIGQTVGYILDRVFDSVQLAYGYFGTYIYTPLSIAEIGFHNTVLTQPEITAMQTLGVASGHEVQRYLFEDAIGTTSGQLTDVVSGQKLTLRNMTAPNGIVAYP